MSRLHVLLIPLTVVLACMLAFRTSAPTDDVATLRKEVDSLKERVTKLENALQHLGAESATLASYVNGAFAVDRGTQPEAWVDEATQTSAGLTDMMRKEYPKFTEVNDDAIAEAKKKNKPLDPKPPALREWVTKLDERLQRLGAESATVASYLNGSFAAHLGVQAKEWNEGAFRSTGGLTNLMRVEYPNHAKVNDEASAKGKGIPLPTRSPPPLPNPPTVKPTQTSKPPEPMNDSAISKAYLSRKTLSSFGDGCRVVGLVINGDTARSMKVTVQRTELGKSSSTTQVYQLAPGEEKETECVEWYSREDVKNSMK